MKQVQHDFVSQCFFRIHHKNLNIRLSISTFWSNSGLFDNFVEPLQRCSNLELVQVSPFPVIRFSFLRVNWVRRISNPAKIKLKVTDLSGSDGWSLGWPLPEGFQNMTPQEQFHGENSF